MKLINSSEMKKYDAKTITELGISSLILMERASLEVFYFIKKNYKKFIKKKKY
jgi:NAD(P)H-hydrate repair Nnr-like enzyme with NAD(P)H-hydrate epimerase domain